MTQHLSNYSKRMLRLSQRIFGEVFHPLPTEANKIVRIFSAKPFDKDRQLVEYYPRYPQLQFLMNHLRRLGLYRDEHQDFADEMKRLKTLRGKIKPKKGEGRQAMKKK